tara:strand:+ start:1452 stop:3014 length:1563 start_codon:yes stop_codon:yes gene_type:complete
MKKIQIFLIISANILISQVEDWNATTFEYLWNKYAYNTKFRESIDLTPFEIKLSHLSYIGPSTKIDYFLPLPWMEITEIDSSSISTKIQNIATITDLGNYKNRILISIEVDLYRYNFLLQKLNQNLIDFQSGFSYNHIEARNGITVPQNLPDSTGWKPTPDNVSGLFEFKPIIESLGIKSTFTWKPTNYFQFTSGTFFGYSVGSIYKSTGGERYLYGAGNRWNVSLISSLFIENSDKNFNYIFGLGFESGGIKLNKINDNKYGISPISGLNIYTFGWNLSFGIQYGGRRTSGDKGFRRIIENDYIGAIERLGQFIRFNPNHPQFKEANELIKKCEKKISFQTYRKGMGALANNDFSNAGYWLKQARDENEPNIKTLAKFQLDKISRILIDSLKNNWESITLNEAENLIKQVKDFSNEFSSETDIIYGKIYLAQGDILLKNGQYSKSLNKYHKAGEVSSELFFIINEKEKTLAKAFLSDASKGFEHGELIFIIQSLKQSKELNPKIDLEIDKLLTILENLK